MRLMRLMRLMLMPRRLMLMLMLMWLMLTQLTRAARDQLATSGEAELLHVQELAAEPRYGTCWARALHDVNTHCRKLTAETQSRLALKFTHCHLRRSGRSFPACPAGSEVSSCTSNMDAVAFSAYTQFFTHTHAICHFLQSEAWQQQAEGAVHSLMESSLSVAQQMQDTRHVAEELKEAQGDALVATQEILRNGEDLRVTLRDSTQGLRELFSELSSSSLQQQVALSEVFRRISFLQDFLLMEVHTLSSALYNAAALCAAFLFTSTRRTARARLVLVSLVCLNLYVERMIYRLVMDSAEPEHQSMERVCRYVGVARGVAVGVASLVLLLAAVRFKDPSQESLKILKELRDIQSSLQESLRQADSLLGLQHGGRGGEKDEERSRSERVRQDKTATGDDRTSIKQEDRSYLSPLPEGSHLSHLSVSEEHSLTSHNAMRRHSHNASVSPGRRARGSAPLVYCVPVDETQRRYSLRSRRSTHTHTDTLL